MEARGERPHRCCEGERNPAERLTHRDGYRDRRRDTRIGTIDLVAPWVHDGSYLHGLLDPRAGGRSGGPLAVVEAAYVSGVSTRRADDLVRAPGIRGHEQERGQLDMPWYDAYPTCGFRLAPTSAPGPTEHSATPRYSWRGCRRCQDCALLR